MSEPTGSDKPPAVVGTWDRGDEVYAVASELHEKLAAIDPKLVVTLSLGHRTRAPEVGARPALGVDLFDDKVPDDETVATFRNYWSNEGTGGFANQFSKFGDGFINVYTLAE